MSDSLRRILFSFLPSFVLIISSSGSMSYTEHQLKKEVIESSRKGVSICTSWNGAASKRGRANQRSPTVQAEKKGVEIIWTGRKNNPEAWDLLATSASSPRTGVARCGNGGAAHSITPAREMGWTDCGYGHGDKYDDVGLHGRGFSWVALYLVTALSFSNFKFLSDGYGFSTEFSSTKARLVPR